MLQYCPCSPDTFDRYIVPTSGVLINWLRRYRELKRQTLRAKAREVLASLRPEAASGRGPASGLLKKILFFQHSGAIEHKRVGLLLSDVEKRG